MNDLGKLQLRPGEFVEVRSAQEILATLDENATLENLPFIPEMLRFCGKKYPVSKRADSTCDTVSSSGMRQMNDTVHLNGLRCDGSAHGNCQAGCLLFWKEAWLKRSSNESSPIGVASEATDGAPRGDSARDCDWLNEQAVRSSPIAPEICYRCQATELKNASQPLPWWKPSQYLRDLFINKVPMHEVVRGFVMAVLNKLSLRFLGRRMPSVSGMLQKTPTEELNLQSGQWVIIKSKEEILATLDKSGRNRGLTFDSEMLPYCGRRVRVLTRVERMIEESTGRLIRPKGTSVILEDVVCTSRYRRPCPRGIYSYWREIWLRRDTSTALQNEETEPGITDSAKRLCTAQVVAPASD